MPFPLLDGDVPLEVIDCGNGILYVIQMYEARLQMRFGSDAISLGDKLIEVNVTSPTCIQEMASFMDNDPIETLLDAIEHKVKN